jgi:hypothetical protein
LLERGKRRWRVSIAFKNDCYGSVRESTSAARSNESLVEDVEGSLKFLVGLVLCAPISRGLYRDSHVPPPIARSGRTKKKLATRLDVPFRIVSLTLRAYYG